MQVQSRRSRPAVAAGILALLVWLFADGRFARRETAAPVRRLSTLERLALPRLAAVHEDIRRLEAIRQRLSPLPDLRDFRVIFHAHAEDSAHTGGTRAEMAADARRAGVDAIFLSDHYRPPRDFMDSWRGFHEDILFVPGSEARGFLIHPMASVMNAMELAPSALLAAVRTNGGLAFLSHIEERPDHPMDDLDGMEIYNRHWDAKRDPATLVALVLWLTDPRELAILREAVERFPDEVLGAQIDYPADYLAKWDSESSHRRLTGVAANDSHHNQVFVIKMIDAGTILLGTRVDPDEKKHRLTALLRPGIREMTRGHQPGDLLASLDLDPYYRSFRNVSTHLFARELTEESLRGALRSGHAYVAHDWMADPTGFQFGAFGGEESTPRAILGDEIELPAGSSGLRLEARFPLPCSRVRLLCHGRQVASGTGDRLAYRVREPGVYRVEGWLMLDAEERCWVLSNPIYVRRTPDGLSAGARQ